MALQLEKPQTPLKDKMRYILREGIEALQENFAMQKIYPHEVYKGWLAENAKRKAANGKRGWFSTGRGLQSIHGTVDNDTPENATLSFFIAEHMLYVDAGVGIWSKRDTIDSDRKAKYDRRYVGAWTPNDHASRTHRPFLRMEMRHVAGRLQNYLRDFYAQEAVVDLYECFTKLDGTRVLF